MIQLVHSRQLCILRISCKVVTASALSPAKAFRKGRRWREPERLLAQALHRGDGRVVPALSRQDGLGQELAGGLAGLRRRRRGASLLLCPERAALPLRAPCALCHVEAARLAAAPGTALCSRPLLNLQETSQL